MGVRAPGRSPAEARFALIIGGEDFADSTDELPDPPSATALVGNYPNPFNPSTIIRFDLAAAAHVGLRVYNVKGELVATLIDAHMTPGRREVSWNATDDGGDAVASGIYFCRLVAGDFQQTRKLVLLR